VFSGIYAQSSVRDKDVDLVKKNQNDLNVEKSTSFELLKRQEFKLGNNKRVEFLGGDFVSVDKKLYKIDKTNDKGYNLREIENRDFLISEEMHVAGKTNNVFYTKSGSLYKGDINGNEKKLLFKGNVKWFDISPKDESVIGVEYKEEEKEYTNPDTKQKFTRRIKQGVALILVHGNEKKVVLDGNFGQVMWSVSGEYVAYNNLLDSSLWVSDLKGYVHKIDSDCSFFKWGRQDNDMLIYFKKGKFYLFDMNSKAVEFINDVGNRNIALDDFDISDDGRFIVYVRKEYKKTEYPDTDEGDGMRFSTMVSADLYLVDLINNNNSTVIVKTDDSFESQPTWISNDYTIRYLETRNDTKNVIERKIRVSE